MYFLLRGALLAAYSLWFNLKFEGLENVPSDGGHIFACNHRSYSDPVFLSIKVKKRFCYLAKEELFQKPIPAWLFRSLGAFAVERGAGDMRVIDEAVSRLKSGKNLAVFPEGTRSKDGKLGRGKSGVALIASKTGADVIPVAIAYGDKLRFRTRVIVRFGAPIAASELAVGEKPALKDISRLKNRIMGAIAELLEQGV